MDRGYIGLCYHYIRSHEDIQNVPRILGHTEEVLAEQCRRMKESFHMVTPLEACGFSYKKPDVGDDRYGVLVTFDDGLRDHYRAAEILADHGIRGCFFIPTCVLKEKLPANPNIIHYGLALYGVGQFLNFFDAAIEHFSLDTSRYKIVFVKGKTKVWDVIGKIKQTFKYGLDTHTARRVLVFIYQEFMLKDYPDLLTEIHLTDGQIKAMLAMRHAIGSHSHSHVSIASSALSEEDFHLEMVESKVFLEKKFGISVDAMSYPFGEEKDCLSSVKLLKKTSQYKLAFTIKPIINKRDTNPLELGRYMLESRDDAPVLMERLKMIISKEELPHARGPVYK